MNAQPAPAASAAIAIPSISWCGFFCISSRSLKAPGSDSSALQHRYFVHLAAGQERGLLAHREPGAAAAAQPGLLELAEQLLGLQLAERPLQRAVAAEPPVGVDRGEPGLVDVAEQHPGLGHRSRRLGFRRSRLVAARGSGPPAAGRFGERLVRQHLGAGAELLDRASRASSASSGP